MAILYCLVVIAVCMDLRNMRISNRLILIGLGIAFLHRCLYGGIAEVFSGIIIAVFPIILLYLLFLAGVLGAGDIKLFSLIGGFVNLKELMDCMLYAFLLAGVFSFFKMMYYKTFISSMQNGFLYLQNLCLGYQTTYNPIHGKKSKIHFSIFILGGLYLSGVR